MISVALETSSGLRVAQIAAGQTELAIPKTLLKSRLRFVYRSYT